MGLQVGWGLADRGCAQVTGSFKLHLFSFWNPEGMPLIVDYPNAIIQTKQGLCTCLIWPNKSHGKANAVGQESAYQPLRWWGRGGYLLNNHPNYHRHGLPTLHP